MRFVFPYVTEADNDSLVVSFPDVPEALTQVDQGEDVHEVVHDCLVTALRSRVQDHEPLPVASPARGRAIVSLDALESAKLALYASMRENNLTNVALSKKLGVTEAVVRRLLDLDHRSHIGRIERALAVMGRRLEVSVKAA